MGKSNPFIRVGTRHSWSLAISFGLFGLFILFGFEGNALEYKLVEMDFEGFVSVEDWDQPQLFVIGFYGAANILPLSLLNPVLTRNLDSNFVVSCDTEQQLDIEDVPIKTCQIRMKNFSFKPEGISSTRLATYWSLRQERLKVTLSYLENASAEQQRIGIEIKSNEHINLELFLEEIGLLNRKPQTDPSSRKFCRSSRGIVCYSDSSKISSCKIELKTNGDSIDKPTNPCDLESLKNEFTP
jgi:hypothetical protein